MIYDVKAAMPIEIKRLHLLAEACKNVTSDEFKSLWYNKMNKYGLLRVRKSINHQSVKF